MYNVLVSKDIRLCIIVWVAGKQGSVQILLVKSCDVTVREAICMQ